MKSEPKIVSVGPDETVYASDWDLTDVSWIVYWYENGGYDGTGVAVAKHVDGRYSETNLGHCSCYGPLDRGFDYVERKRIVQIAELRDMLGRKISTEDFDYTIYSTIGPAVEKMLEKESHSGESLEG